MIRAFALFACLWLCGCDQEQRGWDAAREYIRDACDKKGVFYDGEGVRFRCQREEWKL